MNNTESILKISNGDIIKFNYKLFNNLPLIKIEGKCISSCANTFELKSYNTKFLGSVSVYRMFFIKELNNDEKIFDLEFIVKNKNNHRKYTEL